MAKITLTEPLSGYNLAAINANFVAIEAEFQDKVLYRDNPVGEANSLETDIDVNSKRIYNLPEPTLPSEAARLQDVQNAISGVSTANLVASTPSGNLVATNVQAALNELDTEKVSLAALAASTGSSLVGYLPAGAGAVATTVQTKLRTSVSVFDYMTAAEIFAVTNHFYVPTVGATVTNVTSAIQAAVNDLSTTTFDYNGKLCEVVFPKGLYEVTDEITIPGAVALRGEGAPLSFSGATIRQITNNKNLFVARNIGNLAVYFSNLNLKMSTASANEDRGLFMAEATVTSGNSFYFRDCWFTTPNSFGINIQCNSDDLQIANCTFDVTAQKFIRLGTATAGLTNFSIQGNTFYLGFNGTGVIDIYKATAGVIAGNRFYTGGAFSSPHAIEIKNGLSRDIIIANNTCTGIDTFVITSSGNITVAGNRVTGATTPISIRGGLPLTGITIQNNYLSGASGAAGLVDATGTNLTSAVITGNTLVGNDGGTSAYAMNLTAATYLDGNSIIQNNTPFAVTADGSDSDIAFTPVLAGTATSGTFTYTTQTGSVRRLGRKTAHVQVQIGISAISVAPTGEVVVSGLPFAAGKRVVGSLLLEGVAHPAGGYTQTSAMVDIGTSNIRLIFSGDNLGLNVAAPALFAAGDIIYIDFMMDI